MFRRLALIVCGATIAVAVLAAAPAEGADREVAWVFVANAAAAEREINGHAARGLRFAAVTDGLPCAAVIMQSPSTPAADAASYRVVADRDLATALPALGDEGFEPRGSVRPLGGRTLVVWERAPQPRPRRVTEWRLAEFDNPDTLESVLAPLVREGFEPRLLARVALRSWPGLSEKGLMLLGQRTKAGPREVRVLRGASRNVDALAQEVGALSTDGWDLDVMFTTSRDGSRNTRRERAYFVFTRGEGAQRVSTPLKVVRSSSWGGAGAGEPVATSLFWNDFLFVWRPADRRRTWATPTRLADFDASCAGLSLKLRFDGDDQQRSTIVGVVARPLEAGGGYEMIVVLDERFGF